MVLTKTVGRIFLTAILVGTVTTSCADLELGDPVVESGAGGGGTQAGFAGFGETGTSEGTATGAGQGGTAEGIPNKTGQGGPEEGIPGGTGMGRPIIGSVSGGASFTCTAFCDWYMTCEENPYADCVNFCECIAGVFPELKEPAAQIMRFDCSILGDDGYACRPGMDCEEPEEIETPFDEYDWDSISEEQMEQLEMCLDDLEDFNWMFF